MASQSTDGGRGHRVVDSGGQNRSSDLAAIRQLEDHDVDVALVSDDGFIDMAVFALGYEQVCLDKRDLRVRSRLGFDSMTR